MKDETKETAVEHTADLPQTPPPAEDFHGAYNAEDYIDAPPDGGYGWVCCACICAMNFATWGSNSSFGVMLAFFLDQDEFRGATATDYALVVGILNFFTLSTMSMASVLLLKFGYKTTLCIGIVLQLAAYIGASFATTIRQLHATQGFLLGIAFGIIFGANSIVLPSWFLKRRAVANGVSHFGLGMGGMTFSLVVNALIQRTGNHRWALRALGIISTAICFTAMLFVKVRVPKTAKFQEKEQTNVWTIVKNVTDIKVMKTLPIQLVATWATLGTMAYMICLFSMSSYARSSGYTSTQATMVTVALNISQGFGRPLMGVLSEVCGRVNFTLIAMLYTCVMVFVFWINLSTYASLVAFAVVLGSFVGISSVNVVPLTVDVVGLNGFPAAFSWINLFAGCASLVSEVIALNLRDYNLTSHTPYFHCQIFVGVLYVVGIVVLVPYREWRVRRMMHQLENAVHISKQQRVVYETLGNEKGVKAFVHRAFYPVKI